MSDSLQSNCDAQVEPSSQGFTHAIQFSKAFGQIILQPGDQTVLHAHPTRVGGLALIA